LDLVASFNGFFFFLLKAHFENFPSLRWRVYYTVLFI
jgi:hypothetical protein